MLLPNKTEVNLANILESEVEKISGIKYVADYISVNQQWQLLEIIDQQSWSKESNRNIQQYGYTYKHSDTGAFVASEYLGNLPDWAECLAKQLVDDFFLTPTSLVLDQLLVNEYQPGQGCKSHIDCIPCFGNTIFVLSLGSQCVIDFTHSQTKEQVPILLLPGSLVVLQGAARYSWLHGIANSKIDKYQGREFVRSRRVSLTFREVLFPHK
ncbi:MAG: alpha-ketoglutarate-dependent dioxygenase AlkB [Coleofasciculaceae cyanobacterium]